MGKHATMVLGATTPERLFWSLARLVTATAVFSSSTGVFALPVQLNLNPVSAVAISSSDGALLDTPVPLPGPLPLDFSIDLSSASIQTGPSTDRNPTDTASITSSFARYGFPGVSTPFTSTFLDFFNGHDPVNDFEGADVSVAFFDNDVGEDHSVGSIRLFRQLAFNGLEDGQTRIITYLLDLEIPAADYLGGPGDVSPIDATSIETILHNALPGQIQFVEEVQSYLESGCGRKAGCERSDASGYRYVWQNVPEPGTLSLLSLAAAWLMWRQGKHGHQT